MPRGSIPVDLTAETRPTISKSDPAQRAKDVKKIRLARKFTQQDVFDASGMREFERYARLENGVGRQTLQELQNIANFLGAELV